MNDNQAGLSEQRILFSNSEITEMKAESRTTGLCGWVRKGDRANNNVKKKIKNKALKTLLGPAGSTELSSSVSQHSISAALFMEVYLLKSRPC